MTSSIKLSGNLGERHRCFNALVHDAYLQNTPLPVQKNPEDPAIDRLFKIDLASKQQNLEYIILALKDDDMLYVSRALKSLWLLDPEHSNIINPSFLEYELFPQMRLPAVNKMRHWIQVHLRNPQRCEEFYLFYKEKDFGIAAKFLWLCSNQFILDEISRVLDRITPKLLKRLSEKVPVCTKVYYDNLKHNQTLLKYYLENDIKFYSNVKYLLKTDANLFFYILEKKIVPQKFKSLNAVITRYIMKHHKCRFLWKPELYTAWFLHVETVARCLNSEEIKDLVVKLARAKYLQSWFSYKNIEPLIKCLSAEERTAFSKLVFVRKDFGPMVQEWPYPIPNQPELKSIQASIFDDFQMGEYRQKYDYDCDDSSQKSDVEYHQFQQIKKRNKRTLIHLDDLFDKYRFCNYKETYEELRKQIEAESFPTNRQFMLLVLVSKTGGQTKDLVSFLDVISQHRNEPVHIRATIFRSLVKRAFVWRLPPEYWERLLKWGHGLGLDGSAPEAECREGLHAVLIRDMLAGVQPNEKIWNTFLTNVDTLHDYSFTQNERKCVATRLPELLLAEVKSSADENRKIYLLNRLLDTLAVYHNRFDQFPEAVETVVAAIKDNWFTDDAKSLLRRLYLAGLMRRSLIKMYFEMIQTDASYVNALRHDISLLDDTERFKKLVDKNKNNIKLNMCFWEEASHRAQEIENKELKHERFLRKLAIYFTEEGGLGERYRAIIEHRVATRTKKSIVPEKNMYFSSYQRVVAVQRGMNRLARALVLLSGRHYLSHLKAYDSAPPKTLQRQFGAALRSHAHLARPTFDLESFGWRNAGAKAVANKVFTCRQNDVERYLAETLSWKRSLRLSLVLANRVNNELDVFKLLASARPGAALQAALLYFRREGKNSDPRIWDLVKSLISKTDQGCEKSVDRQQFFLIAFTKSVPELFKAEYSFLVYMRSKRYEPHERLKALSIIPTILTELNGQYILDITDNFLRNYFMDYIKLNEFVNTKTRKDNPYASLETERKANIRYIYLYIEIIAKFLVISTSNVMLEERLEKIGMSFLNSLELFWSLASPKYDLIEKFLNAFMFYLRYNKAFLNVKCVSCLPVFQKITEKMQGFLSFEKWFGKYITVQLTVIYYEAVKECLDLNPRLFSKETSNTEGSKELGLVFGKLISNEIQDLIRKYFPTITELYKTELVDYINEYVYRKDVTFEHFTIGILNALLANKSLPSCILAKYIFDEFQHIIGKECVNDFSKAFYENEVKEVRFEH